MPTTFHFRNDQRGLQCSQRGLQFSQALTCLLLLLFSVKKVRTGQNVKDDNIS